MWISHRKHDLFSAISFSQCPALSYGNRPREFKLSSESSMSKTKAHPFSTSFCKGIRSLTGNEISLPLLSSNQQINAQRFFNCLIALEFALLRQRSFQLQPRYSLLSTTDFCHLRIAPFPQQFSSLIAQRGCPVKKTTK